MVDFDRSAFVAKFQEEAADLLQRLNEGVITLEARPDDKPLIDQMLRDAHTLKGASRMVGLIDISNIAHRLEDIMVKVRDGDMAYTPKKFGRRMWCICDDLELRKAFINWVKTLRAEAKEVYERWKKGDRTAHYPPGMFPPSFPKLANIVPALAFG